MTAVARIAVVEDDPRIAELVASYLRDAGFDVTAFADGAEAAGALTATPPDLVLLDLMLPGLDGLDVCRRLRAVSDVPVIMVTARDAEVDRILGLELGADDYVTKPFSPRELVARVRAVLRRAETAAATTDVLRLGTLTVDVDARRARVGTDEVALTPTEFDLLAHLVRNRGIALSRDRILASVWGYDEFVDPRTIDVHVRSLRRKLADASPIETVRGVGYRVDRPDPS